MAREWFRHICVVFFSVSQVFAEAFPVSPIQIFLHSVQVCRDACKMVSDFNGSIGSCPSKAENRKAFCYSCNLSAFISQTRHLHIWALYNYFGQEDHRPQVRICPNAYGHKRVLERLFWLYIYVFIRVLLPQSSKPKFLPSRNRATQTSH